MAGGAARKGRPASATAPPGNGYAFLKLFERTGDELWLERARGFAMHAIEQVERARAEYGRGRHTLWTGDLGTALYLQSCLAGAPRSRRSTTSSLARASRRDAARAA